MKKTEKLTKNNGNINNQSIPLSILSTKITDKQGINENEEEEQRITHSLSMRCKLQICVKIVTTRPSLMVHHHQLNNISMNWRDIPLEWMRHCLVSVAIAAIRSTIEEKSTHKSEPFLFDHDVAKMSYMTISFNSLEKKLPH